MAACHRRCNRTFAEETVDHERLPRPWSSRWDASHPPTADWAWSARTGASGEIAAEYGMAVGTARDPDSDDGPASPLAGRDVVLNDGPQDRAAAAHAQSAAVTAKMRPAIRKSWNGSLSQHRVVLLRVRSATIGTLTCCATEKGDSLRRRRRGTADLADHAASDDPERAPVCCRSRRASEHKRTRETLNQTEEKFYHCRRWKRSVRLCRGIAHDFNNLLTIVLS